MIKNISKNQFGIEDDQRLSGDGELDADQEAQNLTL